MQPITIEKGEHGFTVRQGDRYAAEIAFEEMLGLLVSLTYPTLGHARYTNWMRTEEEWKQWHDRLKMS